MDLYKEILINYLLHETAQVTFPDLTLDVSAIIELQCYQALQRIKSVITDDSLDDQSCFMKIEEIISILETIGSSGGNRHDFG